MGPAVPRSRGRDRVCAARTRGFPRSDPVVPPVHGGIDPAVREDESLVARRGPSRRARHLSDGGPTQSSRRPLVPRIPRVRCRLSEPFDRDFRPTDRLPRYGTREPTRARGEGRGNPPDRESVVYAFGIAFPGSMNGFFTTRALLVPEGWVTSTSVPRSDKARGTMAEPMFFVSP